MTQEDFVKSMEWKCGMSQEESEIVVKKARVDDLYMEVHFSPMLMQFFDFESEELLDEKIEVLTALKNGKSISEIPKFYDVLELYPKDETHWD